jgi:hypothetical protein
VFDPSREGNWAAKSHTPELWTGIFRQSLAEQAMRHMGSVSCEKQPITSEQYSAKQTKLMLEWTGMTDMEYCEISERFMTRPSNHKETISGWNGPQREKEGDKNIEYKRLRL